MFAYIYLAPEDGKRETIQARRKELVGNIAACESKVATVSSIKEIILLFRCPLGFSIAKWTNKSSFPSIFFKEYFLKAVVKFLDSE